MEEKYMDIKTFHSLAQVQLGDYVPEGVLDETYTNPRLEIHNPGYDNGGNQIAPLSTPFSLEFARVDDKWQRVK